MEHGPIKLGMIILMQTDLKKAVEFYKKLGMVQKFYLEDKWAEFDLGCIKLGLCPTEHAQDNIRTGIVFEIFQDLIAWHKELKEQGVDFVNEPVVAAHGVMVGVKDPGGNVFDLYQPTPEKLKEFIDKQKEQEANASKN
ncbi:VOC family protein [Candidatus Babeliales bacterium]|nr:VOC family protein [Candidatus Babeliales bacterium]